MKKFITLLLVLTGMVCTASAGTSTTVYCAVSTTYTVKLNVKLSSDKWGTYVMTKTKMTYNGTPIYSCTYTDLYDGVDVMQFQLYDGETYKGEKQPYSSYTTVGTYNGKLYRYAEESWVTYYTDGLKGSWDSWTDKIVFEDGVATVDLTAGNYYDFKIEVGNLLYGAQNSGATMFWNNCTNWTLDGSNNCVLQASVTGEYTFTLAENKKVSVTFPAYSPNEVYLYNNMSLAAGPYAYILTGSYWDKDKGSGSKNQPKAVTMTQVGTSNVWKAEYPAGAKSDYIVFTEFLMDNYDNFNGGKAVYRGDFPSTTSVFVPNTSTSDSKNETTYYNNGAWHPFPTYTRTVTSGNFGTICLPFAATVTGATVFKIVSKTVDGESNLTGINLESVDELEAGKAYIFKATSTTLTATMTGNYADASAGYGMMGNISSTPVTLNGSEGYYVVGTDNKIHKVVTGGDGVNVGQYKAYITLAGIDPGARGADYLGFADSETTGIETVKANQIQNGEYFNLAGQRVAQPTKGLYIVNGKKVIIK